MSNQVEQQLIKDFIIVVDIIVLLLAARPAAFAQPRFLRDLGLEELVDLLAKEGHRG